MNYKKTLNLPKMSFPRKADPAKTESEILSLWRDLNVYERRQRANKGKPKYFIHTPPHQVHKNISVNNAFSMILKDIIIKYKLMSDADVPHIPIWNSYVSGIEHEVFKSLENKKTEKNGSSLSAKTLRDNEIHQAEFRELCHKLCTEYVNTQKEQFQRLGIFARWNKATLTSDPDYESEVIRCFESLYNSGYLRKGTKSKFWCINCKSDIDSSEIEYRGYDLLSLHVKFPIMQGLEELGEDVCMLIWIGTPWTLSVNKPVSVNPDYEYAAVEIKNNILIMADSVVDIVMQKYNKSDYSIIKRIKGSDLGEVVCSHPLFDKNSKVIFDKHISLERGTGCVYNVSSHLDQNDSNLETISPINFNGILNGEYDDANSYNIFDPINPISMELERRGYLLSSDLMEQSYPHCSYCKQPLIIRDNEHWIFDFNPSHLKQHTNKAVSIMSCHSSMINRISSCVNDIMDWGISRRRIWGIPIPVFYCKKCDQQFDVIEGIKSCRTIIERDGFAKLLATDPNDILPYDSICSNCETRNFRWEMDILNEDFISVLSYKTILWNQKDSSEHANICLESDSQNGKWSYLSLLSSMALESDSLFNSVIIHGPVISDSADLDRTLIQNLIDEFGADVIRLCAISADPNKRSRIDHPHIKSVSNIYTRIRNIFRYLLANLEDFEPENDKVEYEYLKEIDKWILHRLAKFTDEMTKAFENYQYNRIYHLLCNFCFSDISSIYISIIKRKLYTYSKWSTGRRSIQTAIYEILTTLAKVMAPVLSFTADEIWGYIPNVKDEFPSVYMSKWANMEEYLNDNLEQKWDYLLKVRSAIYKTLGNNSEEEYIRNSSQASITLYAHSYDTHNKLNSCADILEEVLMVSKIRLTPPDEPIPDDINILDGMDDISIEVRLTTGDKCERCYIYSDTVGTSELYPTICHKCVSILDGETEYV
jgi:isoleucyl-tRNA synthetase